MPPLLIAIHGILTNQTDASWPDRLDAWMYRRDPRIKVLKKEYSAGPFPRWNCWVKDPRLARSLANELELFLEEKTGFANDRVSIELPRLGTHQAGKDWTPLPQSLSPRREEGGTPQPRREEGGNPGERAPSTTRTGDSPRPELWFVAHSNGAVIALLTARRLIARGHKIGGLILTGAACEAHLAKNGILEWLCSGVLGAAIAYCSPDDEVLDGSAELWDRKQGRGRVFPGIFELLGSLAKLAASISSRSARPIRTANGDEPSPPLVRNGRSLLHRLRVWLWGKLMWPYGCLGRTGWLLRDQPLLTQRAVCPLLHLSTRWFPGGHCTYFKPQNIEATFEQIYKDVVGAGGNHGAGDGASVPGGVTCPFCPSDASSPLLYVSQTGESSRFVLTAGRRRNSQARPPALRGQPAIES